MDINDLHDGSFQLKPVGDLSIIGMKGCEEITSKIDWYLKEWRKDENGVIYSDSSGPIKTF